MQPTIKLLRTPESCYFYDTNKNSIIRLSEEEYCFLQSLETIQEDSLKDFPHLFELYQNGYLHELQVCKIEHPLTPYLGDLLNRCLQKVTLQLTQNCNFRCSYCTYTHSDGSQRTHAHHRMSFEIAKKAVDYLFEHSIDSREVYIGFYGGEPLLEFPLMKKVVEYANELFESSRLRYTTTTNASMLNDEIIAFFKEHHFSVVISLDGPEKIHDKNRVFAENGKGTFRVVIEKLKSLYNNNPDFFKKITINMVIDPSNNFDDVLSLFSEYPFLNECNSQINVIDDYFSDKKNVVSENYIQSMEYQKFLGYLYLLNRISVKDIPLAVLTKIRGIQNESFKKFSPRTEIDETTTPSGPCLPGKSRLLVTYDGRFIPCERVSETSDAMCLGTLETGIDLSKAQQLLNVSKITAEECKKCWAFSLCSSCAKYADDHGKLSKEKRLSFCHNFKDTALNSIYEQILLKECQS